MWDWRSSVERSNIEEQFAKCNASMLRTGQRVSRNGGEEENNIIGSKVRKEKRAEEEYFCRREGWGEGFLELVRLRAPYFPYRGGKKWVKRWRSLVASEPGGKSSMRQKVQRRNQEDALLLPFAALSAHRRIRHLFSTRSRNHLSRDIFYLRFNDVVPSDFTILFSFSPPHFSKWRFHLWSKEYDSSMEDYSN